MFTPASLLRGFAIVVDGARRFLHKDGTPY